MAFGFGTLDQQEDPYAGLDPRIAALLRDPVAPGAAPAAPTAPTVASTGGPTPVATPLGQRIAGTAADLVGHQIDSLKSAATLPGDVYAGREAFRLPSETPDLSRVGDMVGAVALQAPLAPKGGVGIFGGRLSQTADHAALARGMEMAERGAPRQEIWDKTGWFQGRDGQWRYEINDYPADLNPSRYNYANGMVGLPAAPQAADAAARQLHHKDLYAAYPDMRKMQMTVEQGPGTGSYAQPWQGAPGLVRVEGRGIADGRSIALHEMQHAVQNAEGFASGASLRHAEVLTDPEVQAARLTRLRSDNPQDPALLKAQERATYDAYRRAAGEVESRNVQARQDMTPAERRMTPPWMTQDTPDERQIVFGFGTPGGPQSFRSR